MIATVSLPPLCGPPTSSIADERMFVALTSNPDRLLRIYVSNFWVDWVSVPDHNERLCRHPRSPHSHEAVSGQGAHGLAVLAVAVVDGDHEPKRRCRSA